VLEKVLNNSTRPGLNSAVALSFVPIAFERKRFGNGTDICPTAGELVDGRLVDTNCDVDKFEICLVRSVCAKVGCDGGAIDPAKQASVSAFLGCFEVTPQPLYASAAPPGAVLCMDAHRAFTTPTGALRRRVR
jgi:hypothetical protein